MRWGVESGKRITHALVLIFLRTSLLMFLALGVIGPALFGDDFTSHGWQSVLFIFAALGVLDFALILQLGLLRFGRVSLRELGWTFETPLRDIARGLLGFFIAGGVLMAAYIASGDPLSSVWHEVLGYSLTQRIIWLAIAVFGAALVEETLFRGYLQPALAHRFGLPLAIVLQALLFDLMHMNFRPASLIVKLIFGVIFGVLRGKDRSLLAPGIAHGLIWAVFGA